MQGYVAEKERDLSFRPQINDQSRALDRTVDHLVHHAQDWNQTRQQREDNIYVKPKVQGVQIGAASDKVVHDRFDQDFTRSCIDLGIISDAAQAEEYREDVKVGCG